VPFGTRLWSFGSSRYSDSDGWNASAGATLAAGPGYIDVMPRDGRALLDSPAPLALARGETDLLVLGLDPAAIAAIEVEARTSAGAWVRLVSRRRVADLQATSAGLSVPLTWPRSLPATDQIRLSLWFPAAAAAVRIRHIALYASLQQAALKDSTEARAASK
jgi:hypothetical protein